MVDGRPAQPSRPPVPTLSIDLDGKIHLHHIFKAKVRSSNKFEHSVKTKVKKQKRKKKSQYKIIL